MKNPFLLFRTLRQILPRKPARSRGFFRLGAEGSMTRGPLKRSVTSVAFSRAAR